MGVRCLTETRSELQLASESLKSRDNLAAVSHLRRAARWHFPGTPGSEQALEQLKGIALRAERSQDSDLALFAWRAVRGGILATRHLSVPHPQRLAEANRHIATLMAHSVPKPPMDRHKSNEKLYHEHLALLKAAHARPNPWWGLTAILGLVGWIASIGILATRAVRPSTQAPEGLSKRIRWPALALSAAVSLLLFFVGLLQA